MWWLDVFYRSNFIGYGILLRVQREALMLRHVIFNCPQSRGEQIQLKYRSLIVTTNVGLSF